MSTMVSACQYHPSLLHALIFMLNLSKRQAGEALCTFKQSKAPSVIGEHWRESGQEHTKETGHLNATAISKKRRLF
jgi:hypothetical protein